MEIKPDSPFLKILPFRAYRYDGCERQAKQFMPEESEPQTIEIEAPWGGTLVAKKGDYLVSEVDNPDDTWVVQKSIFDTTYIRTRMNLYVKSSCVNLVPLTEVTGNPDEEVVIHTLEGVITVRSGDFYLALGVEKEIWPIPKDKIGCELIPLDD